MIDDVWVIGVIKTLISICSFCQFMAPYHDILKNMQEQNSSDGYNSFPFITSLYFCISGIFTAIMLWLNDFLFFLMIHVTGLIISIFVFISFYKLSQNNPVKLRLMRLCFIAFTILLIIFWVALLILPSHALFTTLVLYGTFGFLFYASPLLVMFRGWSPKQISTRLASTSLLTTALWILYGQYVADEIGVIVMNGLFFTLSLEQCIVYKCLEVKCNSGQGYEATVEPI